MQKHHYKIILITGLRFIRSLGIFYAGIFIALFLIGIVIIIRNSNILLSVVLNFVIILLVHHFRKDHEFLKFYFKNHWSIYAIDYFVLSIPILYSITSIGNWILLLGYSSIILLFIWCMPRVISSRFTNVSLGFISPTLLIFKSNIRLYYPVFILIIIVLYVSVYLHLEIALQAYCYQTLVITIATLPTESFNGWYLKNFNEPQDVIIKFVKSLTKFYSVIVVIVILPFLTDFHLIVQFSIISFSGLLALLANLFFALRFRRNKIVLALFQMTSIVAIIFCTVSVYVIIAQFLLTIFSIYSSIKSLKSEFVW